VGREQSRIAESEAQRNDSDLEGELQIPKMKITLDLTIGTDECRITRMSQDIENLAQIFWNLNQSDGDRQI
jgi:hypothetical protein